MGAFPKGLKQLIYYPEIGYGFYPVDNSGVYDSDYFKKYQDYTNTEIGRAISQARVDLVRRHYSGAVVDIGIGCGDFVITHGNAFGYDVNPAGIEWLKEKNLWIDPYEIGADAICCWDSLEHIENPSDLIETVEKWIFVSVPIFRDAEHILKSKHFRKDEHFHYFTHDGFVSFMDSYGFEMVEYNAMESELGREDIGSYAFRRKHG